MKSFWFIMAYTWGLFVGICGSSHDRGHYVKTEGKCVLAADYKGAADDHCTIWTDNDGNLVVGPIWGKPHG